MIAHKNVYSVSDSLVKKLRMLNSTGFASNKTVVNIPQFFNRVIANTEEFVHVYSTMVEILNKVNTLVSLTTRKHEDAYYRFLMSIYNEITKDLEGLSEVANKEGLVD